MSDRSAQTGPRNIAIVGAGAVGSALALALSRAGHHVRAIASRTGSSARRLAERVHARAVSAPEQFGAEVDAVFLCVPDDVVADVAETLAKAALPWNSIVGAHTSGVVASTALAPLAARGAEIMSFHPVQSFAEAGEEDPFTGITITLEGSTFAVAVGAELATAIGARPLPISVEQKRMIHLAASIASNFAVTLAGMAVNVGKSGGISHSEMLTLLRPLIAGTCRNLGTHEPEAALTGPIVRADVQSVRRHLELLREELPAYEELYRMLARETIQQSTRAGRLSPDRAAPMLRLLE